MKTLFTLFTILFISISSFAQQGINYKALIKDDLGNVVANELIEIQFTILTGVSGVYQETHSPTTDNNGIVIVHIGEGIPSAGPFDAIDWAEGSHFLNVQINTGEGLTDMGTTEFMAVPYAISSGDKSWESEFDNVHIISKKAGIGTDTPTELLEISDSSTSGIKLSVPTYSDTSKIEFSNGIETGLYTFFKIKNHNDELTFEVNTDYNGSAGFEEQMSISDQGVALEHGVRINEFSNDSSLGGFSTSAVPTESAVRFYVEAAIAAARPLAIGSIAADGTIISGSGNYSIIWNNIGKRYEISINGENYNTLNFTTIVTPVHFSNRTAVTGGVNAKLMVYLFNDSGEGIQGPFHFITYKN